MIVQAALRTGTRMLREAGIDDPGRDARKLMAAAIGVVPARLTLHSNDPIGHVPEAAFFADVMDRCAGKPVSHLLGWREFYGRRFQVDPAVLDPRPETEILIETALSDAFSDVLDLGVGSGCILLTLLAERPDATGIGSDVSKDALYVAECNADSLGVAGRCALIESNWFAEVGGQFDLIVSNPPYIAAEEMAGLQPELSHEPRLALTDEGDGLSAYRAIVPGAPQYLRSGGRLVVEIGWTQGRAVCQMFRTAGFAEVAILSDLDGRDRVISGIWHG